MTAAIILTSRMLVLPRATRSRGHMKITLAKALT
jgi:hypothetical protein